MFLYKQNYFQQCNALLKPVVFVLALLPFIKLSYGAVENTLGVNPVETLLRTTGDWAFYFLLITLSITPLVQLLKFKPLMKLRRILGLYAFFYACLHLLSYIWFDQYFDWQGIFKDIVKRPFISLGFVSFVLLSMLAISSTNAMMRRLKKNWKRLHQLIYLISVLVLLHYFMMIKADYEQPIVLLLLLFVLLASRLRLYSK